MHDAHAAHADKVEKGLLKNLLIGYVVAPNPVDKQQVLKLISSVLDFDAAESERCGLNRGQSLGWIGAIRNAASVVGGATANGKITVNLERKPIKCQSICVFRFVQPRRHRSSLCALPGKGIATQHSGPTLDPPRHSARRRSGHAASKRRRSSNPNHINHTIDQHFSPNSRRPSSARSSDTPNQRRASAALCALAQYEQHSQGHP